MVNFLPHVRRQMLQNEFRLLVITNLPDNCHPGSRCRWILLTCSRHDALDHVRMLIIFQKIYNYMLTLLTVALLAAFVADHLPGRAGLFWVRPFSTVQAFLTWLRSLTRSLGSPALAISRSFNWLP